MLYCGHGSQARPTDIAAPNQAPSEKTNQLFGDRPVAKTGSRRTTRKKRRTPAQILQAVRRAAKRNGGECLTDEFIPVAEGWRFRCEAGHRFTRRASDVIYKDFWCPKCGGRNNQAMMSKVRAVARRRGGKCLSKTYAARPKKLQFECKEGHHFEALAGLVLYNDLWCGQCAKQPSKSFLHRFEKALQKRGGTLVSGKVGKLSEPHRFRCAKNHIFEQLPTKILSAGHWCAKCSYAERADERRLGLEAAKRAAEEHGGECLANDYENASQHALWRCKEGHEWRAKFTAVIHSGTWCPECWNERRRGKRDEPSALPRALGIEDCHALAGRNEGMCLTGYYVNYLHPMAWRCVRKHEWMASLHSMEQRNSFCVECAEIERRQEWLHKAHEFAGKNGGRCLSTEWTSAQSKLDWRCANGHEFSRAWNNIIHPPFCGQCAIKEKFEADGARFLTELAERHGGRWIETKYQGRRARYTFECRGGCQFEATPTSANNSWDRLCNC